MSTGCLTTRSFQIQHRIESNWRFNSNSILDIIPVWLIMLSRTVSPIIQGGQDLYYFPCHQGSMRFHLLDQVKEYPICWPHKCLTFIKHEQHMSHVLIHFDPKNTDLKKDRHFRSVITEFQYINSLGLITLKISIRHGQIHYLSGNITRIWLEL